MPQIHCSDLHAGDIMLKVSDGSLTSKIISGGQSVFGKVNKDIVHAGVMADQETIVEAQAAGVSSNSLMLEDQNYKYAYYVFRCTDGAVAQGAGDCAKLLADTHREAEVLPYSKLKAALSLFGGGGGQSRSRIDLDQFWTGIFEGSSTGLFCSQLVVLIYQLVGEQFRISGTVKPTLFSQNDKKMNPADLASALNASPNFVEVGWMFSRER